MGRSRNTEIPQSGNGFLVTPSDSLGLKDDSANNTGFQSTALYIGTGGDVAVIRAGGNSLVYKNVPDGTFMPILVSQVLVTGTTATDIIAETGLSTAAATTAAERTNIFNYINKRFDLGL